MKHFTLWKSFLLLCALVVGSNVWADNESYTIIFNASGTGDGTKQSTSTSCASIISEGDEYVTGNLATASNVYSGGSWLKLGTSSGAGTLKMNLTNKVKPTSVVISAKYYNSSKKGKVGFNGATKQTTAANFTDYTFSFDGNTEISYLQIESDKYIWVESITVNYEVTKTATTTTITSTGITNTDLKNGTAAGSLSASVIVTSTSATVDGATITWSSNDESIAEVSTAGVVTLKGVGTTKIKATYAGDATYASSNAEYEITVTDTRVATTTTIDASGITNSDLKKGTAAGSLSANVTVTSTSAAVDGATVTWESEDEDVATIAADGTVTLVGVGTTTITASYAGGGDYAASSNTYNLTVVDTRQETTISITNFNTLFGTSYNGSIADANWPDDNKYLEGTQNNVTVRYAKATGSYGYLKDAELRLYGNNTLSITAPSGYVVSKVVFEGNISNDKAPTVDEGTYTNSTMTWEGVSSSLVYTGTANYAKITSITITLAHKLSVSYADGWMSYVTPSAIIFPENVEAYVVTALSPSLTREKLTAAPEGTPVVLHATEGAKTYALPVAASATAPASNELKVSDGSIMGNGKIYVLTVKGGQAGFAPLKTTSTLSAGKVYIEFLTAPAKDFIGFDDGETTSIESIHNSWLSQAAKPSAQFTIHTDAPMLNLSGQRVSESYKGIVIVNGKKVIRK